MASNRSVDNVVDGINLNVEVVSKYNNNLLVICKSHNLKGVLLPSNEENNYRLENFINECQKIENNNIEKVIEQESLFCVPDSTLSHSAVESNMAYNAGSSEDLCNKCKCNLKKPVKRKSVNRELENLKKHGFNETILKKKNISRRVQTKHEELVNGKKEKLINRKKKSSSVINDKNSDTNISSDALDKVDVKNETLSIRKTKDRALKTKANEKIIDLCTRKPSRVKENKSNLELKKKSKLEMSEISENSPLIKMSDTSIYDFVDEDYESEPIKPLYKENKKSYFVDKSLNSTKLDKRSYKRKSPKMANNNNNNKDDEVHSNPGIMSYEYKGVKFSINNIVWAKIPGYPFWPAHIKSFDNVSASKSQGKRCRINWIGWDQKSFLPLKSLLHFEQHFKIKYSAKFKSQKYKTAIELACKELDLNLDDLLGDMAKKSPISDRNNSSQNSIYGKRKSIDLDDIFPAKKNSKNIMEIDMVAKASYSDEDTDEEEKARSALITAESLEADKIRSDIISKKSEYDF